MKPEFTLELKRYVAVDNVLKVDQKILFSQFYSIFRSGDIGN